MHEIIVWDIRVPRILVGFLAGAGLAVAGATLQSITRNGLADPYLFGVISGAGLGASIAILFLDSQWAQQYPFLIGLSDFAFSFTLPVAAFLGALFAVTLVQILALTAFGSRTQQMLLAGVAVSFMLGALTHFLLFLGEPFAVNKVIFWLMGSLARAENWQVWVISPVLLISVTLLLVYGRHLDALLIGDDNASTLGVNVRFLRLLALAICAALTASIVAYCGGIGFVGLMIPHIARSWFGVTSRRLVLGCLLLGGIFMVWVDVVARTAISGQEIPIGIITAAIGSVFFILTMHRMR